VSEPSALVATRSIGPTPVPRSKLHTPPRTASGAAITPLMSAEPAGGAGSGSERTVPPGASRCTRSRAVSAASRLTIEITPSGPTAAEPGPAFDSASSAGLRQAPPGDRSET
jgi:hypothetical protein